MIAVVVPLSEGSLLPLLLFAGCVGAMLLRFTEWWFHLPHTLHRWCVGWGLVVGVGVFLHSVWRQLPYRQDVTTGQVAAGVSAGLLTALALAFLTPPVLFVYRHVVCRARGLWAGCRKTAPKENLSSKGARRREDARARCEIQFNLHAPELGERFTREMFDDFLARHMGDDRPPEDVEKRAGQLLQVIRQHAESGKAGGKDLSVAERARHLEEQIRQIRESNLADREKETLIVMLKRRFMTGLQQEIEGP